MPAFCRGWAADFATLSRACDSDHQRRGRRFASTPIVAELLQLDAPPRMHGVLSRTGYRLEIVTLGWKVIECSVTAYAAYTAHSPALLAFGSDSVVELVSAVVVLSQGSSHKRRLSEFQAARLAGILLSVLAVVVVGAAVGSFLLHLRPDTSRSGMAITLASLLLMPILAYLKRAEAQRIGNAALAADAVQSATCAYLALLALLGLGANAAFGIAWFDDLAALLAVPILLREAHAALQGHAHRHA